MTKTFKQIKEEIANVSAGFGVRGFGDVSGTPKVGDEPENNPHIDRVIQGADENNNLVNQLIKNNSYDLYDFDDDNWWAQAGAKGSSLTGLGKSDTKGNKTKGAGLEFDTVKHSHGKHKGIVQEEIGGVSGAAGIANVAGSGYIAGVGSPLEGKPSNWGEPGISKKNRKKHKILTRAKPNEVGTAMKEIPIQEVKTGMFAGHKTFIVSTHVYEKALHEKRKGKHWQTYIKDETFHPAIRKYAYESKGPIIFEDEKTGYMSYARYSRKKH